ncbi:unnamed protein product [Brassica oleracea]
MVVCSVFAIHMCFHTTTTTHLQEISNRLHHISNQMLSAHPITLLRAFWQLVPPGG